MSDEYISTRDELAFAIWDKIMQTNGFEIGTEQAVKDTLLVLEVLFDQHPRKTGEIIPIK